MDLMALSATLTLDSKDYEQGIKKAQTSGNQLAANLEKSFGRVKTALKAAFTVAAVKKSVDGIMNLANTTAQAADRIDKQSQALGISRKAFQQWDYILSQSGASIDSLGVSMKTLNSAILGGGDSAVAAFDQLGLKLEDLQGLSQEDAFGKVVDAFQRMPQSARKSALAVQLLGKQGQSLMPLLNTSSEGMAQLRANTERLGFVMSDSMIDAGVKFGDTLDDLKRTGDGLKNTLGYALMEPLTGIFEAVTDFFAQEDTQTAVKQFAVDLNSLGNLVLDGVQGFFQFLTDNQSTIAEVAGNISQFVGDLFKFATDNADIIGLVLGLVIGFKLMKNPLGLIVTAITSIAANWPAVKEFFSSKLPEWINETFDIDLSGVELPDVNEVVDKIKNWWNGGEGGGGAKEKVAQFLDWYLNAPGEPQGDPVEVISNWWNGGGEGGSGMKDKVVNAIKWALNLPSAPPYESGQELNQMIVEWWTTQKEKLEALLTWAIGIPDVPDDGALAAFIETASVWWTTKVVPMLENVANFTLGMFGLPPLDETIEAIRTWWSGDGGVVSQIDEFLKATFGFDMADIGQAVSDIQGWWNDVLSRLGDYLSTTFGINLPSISSVVASIQSWWSSVVSSVTLSLPSIFGGSPAGTRTSPGGTTYNYNGRGGATGWASGLDYVQNNGMHAILHEGEAVLNKRDATAWRSGGQPQISAAALASAVSSALEGMAVVMDKEQVGRLTAQTVSRELERKARAGRFAFA